MGGDDVASEADGAGAAVINVQADARPASKSGKKRGKGNKKAGSERNAARRAAAAGETAEE